MPFLQKCSKRDIGRIKNDAFLKKEDKITYLMFEFLYYFDIYEGETYFS